MQSEELISSPLNYTGGKFKLLSQILPLFPEKIETFVDLFAGGCNVGINVEADRIIFNDTMAPLIKMYSDFKGTSINIIFKNILAIIEKYNLSDSTTYGYAHYNSFGSEGLSTYNKSSYSILKSDYNKLKETKIKSFYLYVLIVYGFNNQIRFNSKGEFNLPVGKRDFNEKMKSKLKKFKIALDSGNYDFLNKSFLDFDLSELNSNSLIYCDPPYLITTASYNENNGWGEKHEKELLYFLDKANELNIKFALSNVFLHRGRKNDILIEWVKKQGYHVFYLRKDYNNSNYQIKDRTSETQEVLVTNYKLE